MKVSYKSNFDKGILLFNLPIEIIFEEFNTPIILNIPTVYDFIYSNEVNYFLEMLDNKHYWKNNGRFIVNSRLNMLLASLQFFKDEILQKTFKKIFTNIEIIDNHLVFEKKIITSDQFDVLFEMILIACALKEFDDNPQVSTNDELDDFMKRQKEYEAKINKTKKVDDSKKFDFSKALITVVSFFPQYKLEDILNLNYYTFYQLYTWALKRDSYFIAKVAAGNGLLKDELQRIY